MKGSLMLGALCALGAAASPLNKRVFVTDVEVTVVTVTVTETPSAIPSSTSTSTSTSITQAAAPKIVNEAHQEPTYSWPPWPTTTSASLTSISSTSVVIPPTTTVPVETSTSTSAVPTGTGDSYQQMLLDSHNIHRSNHSAPALSWNDTLAESALALANTCDYHHDTSLGPASSYGQNIAYGVDMTEVNKIITDMMYNDEMMYYQDLYGQANPDMSNFEHWGHYSQIVWVNTQSVGCATVTCSPLAESGSNDALPFTVCDYYPAGNYGGEYADNVLQPLGQAMVQV
ncbi:CAP domain-containing protein [Talaromyces proteolyticus]|uniref:CAP domain-containing protein n=1 Tax=Talaromyces proteolyticus TaxID=1131652 RepID=A0AAD4L1Q8_9EURO|nr:CAP domain-containing protein [Talaromyces proteolyticus]KAH8704026.1 CAP domain-containing protein [Talaromyces proteolyticus]